MQMRSTGKKKDTNQPAMVKALRAAGFSVSITHTLGNGFPDLAVGYNGVTLLVEVKTKSGKLSEDEKAFMVSWNGSLITARTPSSVVEWFYHELCNERYIPETWKHNALEICNAIYDAEMAKLK